MDKVSAELFCFTYGAMVSQLLRQYKDAAEVLLLPLSITITATRMKCCLSLGLPPAKRLPVELLSLGGSHCTRFSGGGIGVGIVLTAVAMSEMRRTLDAM